LVGDFSLGRFRLLEWRPKLGERFQKKEAVDPFAGWEAITSAEHKFKAKMPGKPRKDTTKSADGRTIVSWEVKDGKITTGGEFSVNVGKSQFPGKVVDKAYFDRTAEVILKGFEAKLVAESDLIRNDKVIGRQMTVEIPDLSLKGKIIFASAHGWDYQLNVMGQPRWEGWNKVDRFFDSFELLVE
jgi:hypothetical protein